MNSTKTVVSVLIFFLLSAYFFIQSSYAAVVNDGVLIQAENDTKIFYLDGGEKRWIETLDAFLAHGFQWEDVQKVTEDKLVQYPAGSNIRADSIVIFPREKSSLPDLTPFALYDFRFSERLGRAILKFSSTYWNRGNAPLELIGDPKTAGIPGTVERDVFQRIVRSDGTERHKTVGSFEWHAEHSHYHYTDFARYIFETGDLTVTAPIINEKATRCLWDTEAFDLGLRGAPPSKTFNTCKNKELQGVSVGWGDTYDYTLADQYLDVHDIPKGLYKISLVIDPLNKFVEAREDNNISAVLVDLDVKNRKIEVIAAGAPFQTPRSRFKDGMLIRGEGDEKVYVITSNKRRWIRDEQVFNSYGFSWQDIRVFEKIIVDSIPFNNFLTVDGRDIYALNDFGYKRRLKSSDVLSFYSIDSNSVVYINQAEFLKYPVSRVLRKSSSENLYSINNGVLQPLVSPFLLPQFTWEEVHVINQREFEDYSIVQ